MVATEREGVKDVTQTTVVNDNIPVVSWTCSQGNEKAWHVAAATTASQRDFTATIRQRTSIFILKIAENVSLISIPISFQVTLLSC